MKYLILAAFLVLQTTQGPPERATPPGEWCQRPEPQMDRKAHPCTCNKHNCDADPRNPNSLSAHTDPKCENYCTTEQCFCQAMDCP